MRFFELFGTVFFLLMLLIPTTFQVERGVLLSALLTAGLLKADRVGWQVNRSIFRWGLVTILASLMFMVNGAINGAPGALRLGTVYVLWPMVFLFLIGLLNRPSHLVHIQKIIIIGSLGAALMALLLVIDGILGLGLGMSTVLEPLGAGVGLYEGAIEFQLVCLTTLIYSFPFLMAHLMLPAVWSPVKGHWRTLTWITLVLTALVMVVSGRRGFWLIGAISPFASWGLLWLAGMGEKTSASALKILALCLALVLVTVFIFNIDLTSAWSNLAGGFDFTDVANLSSYYRMEQFFALLDGWSNSPVLGAGLGSTVKGVLRSQEQPWAYELSYMALLFHTGILGVLVYGSGVAWIFIKGIHIMRQRAETVGLFVPALVGLGCFLVANATNPYLQKFDFLWTIFLPIAILNAYMKRGYQ